MSLEPSARRHAPVPPVFVVSAALGLRRLLLRAADLVVPSYVGLVDRLSGGGTAMLVATAARLRIADQLVAGPLTAGEIASRVGLPQNAAERLMMALVAYGIFKRDREGRYANNHTSSGLVTDAPASTRGFAEFFGHEEVARAWAGMGDTLSTGKNAFERVHGRSLWEWLEGDEEARAAFIEGMNANTEMMAPAVATAFPFNEVKRLCDVGGGMGALLVEVMSRHDHVEGVLLESEHMLAEARPRFEAAGLAHRIELSPGNFLESVPRGCDAYLIKTVLHNWDDDRALRILQNCRAAMDPGHRLLAVEFQGEPDNDATLVRFMDMFNWVAFNDGRERSKEDLRALFGKAGFDLGRVAPMPASMAIYEGIAR